MFYVAFWLSVISYLELLEVVPTTQPKRSNGIGSCFSEVKRGTLPSRGGRPERQSSLDLVAATLAARSTCWKEGIAFALEG